MANRTKKSAVDSVFLGTLEELKAHYSEFCWESQVWGKNQGRRSPYRVMILFGLSARTKDKLLEETCHRFFQLFPDPASLTGGWAGYQSGLNPIIRKGQIPFVNSLVTRLAEWGGVVAKERERLLEITGVGEKIAECVLAYGWGIESLPMDGNGCRLYQRLVGLPDVAKAWNATHIRDDIKSIFHRNRKWMFKRRIEMIDIHELLRLHSQLVCGRGPDCQRCPVSGCLSRRREYLGGEVPDSAKGLWQEWRELILEPKSS